MLDQRGRLLRAALGFLTLEPREPALRLLHEWLDTWRGIGEMVIGMKRQGYEVSLGDHGSGQWIAVFYEGHGGYQPLEAAGTAQAPTPWTGGAAGGPGCAGQAQRRGAHGARLDGHRRVARMITAEPEDFR